MKIKNITCLLFLALWLSSCTSGEKGWVLNHSADLGDVAPLGMALNNNQLWLSDSDENILVRLEDGKVVEQLEGFDRPMHIAASEGRLYVPEFGIDTIRVLGDSTRIAMVLQDSLDAPAGVDVRGEEVAIADFYNHRVLYYDGSSWTSIGQKGHGKGDLYYPTDVQITSDKIYVADAYNNRVQVFDLAGNSIGLLGAEEGMNAATGIFVSKEEVFVTDFENDRVLIFDFGGKLKQVLSENMNKPTDLLLHGAHLVVANYKAKRLDYYLKK